MVRLMVILTSSVFDFPLLYCILPRIGGTIGATYKFEREIIMNESIRNDIISLYNNLIKAWNDRDAEGMAASFSEEGIQIGFDGSKLIGQEDVLAHVAHIFESHPTPPFITKIKGVRLLGSETALLHAIAGMVPPGESDIEPSVNAHQTLIAVRHDRQWQVELFQNTPAQFHGRPELVDDMTEELRKVYFNK